MQNKIMKWFVYGSGVICLYAFLAVRTEPLFNLFLKERMMPEYWENTKYGELYYLNNYIKYFREKNLPHYIPKYRFTKKHPKLNDADILTFGDSFFDFSRMVTFPERLGDTLHKKVYYQRLLNDHRPAIYLQKENYSNADPKLLVYETSERFLAFRFLNRHDTVLYVDKRSNIRKATAAARDWLFLKKSEVKYTVLMQRSIFTTDIYSTVATLKFDAFRYITESTPVYSLKYNTPWLFYTDEVNADNTSFYYKFSDEEINRICDNIADMASYLKRHYNLHTVFIPIPSKYSIYHKLINNDPYSNFLPRIYEGLDKRGVPVVNLYDLYNRSDEILYYGTDNHWNKKGLDMAMKEALSVMADEQLINIPDVGEPAINKQKANADNTKE
jgi:hypothetical protein